MSRLSELGGELDHPEGVCWNPDAGVLYAGGELGQLYRLTLDGAIDEVARFPGFVLGVAVDGRGHVVACCKAAGVWRWDGDDVALVAGGFALANFPAFGADGTLYVSDSGSGWGANDGCVRAGDEVLSRDAPHFTNGLAISPDGRWLWVAESYEPRVGRIELASGRYEEVIRIDGTVPDGLAFDDAGGVLISCYRPDRVYRLDASGELSVVAEDPQGTLLAAPTNVCFAGPGLDRVVVANLGRWHLTVVDGTGLRGVPLHPAVKVQLLPERGLDVGEAWFAGRQLAWLSGRGFGPWNGDWGSSWGGGLVTTCGLDNVGAASEGIGLHGTYSSLPARDGVIDDPRGLRVERTVATDDGFLRLVDRTTSLAGTALEAPLLYHVNLGDWAQAVESDATAVVPRDEDAEPHDPAVVPPPGDGPERVWEHRYPENHGATWARIRGNGIELEVRSNLPRLWQWLDPAQAALGIEPANCSVLGRAHDRAAGRLPLLAPGETRETWLEITAKETTR